ncbi:hypothetical protein F5Y17DRAFT_462758 [Xylariaceae sp. FL0594]|nr:hypothetical protein F5Y17DRAFT_462758 [Xylariaceae sp. FL0594]
MPYSIDPPKYFEKQTWGAHGLNLLYDPPNPLVDLIFEWLPREQGLEHARIHSFGYNSDWADARETVLDLHDFGRALLAEMSTSPSLRGGETPIILIGHSMGGLVIKKAYILARQDHINQSIADRILCMFFLATPHRGSDSARLLNNILQASIVLSSRQYITDIFKGSFSLQIINDEFSAYKDQIQLWSFYETMKTKTGPGTASLIVERDSAVLGYKGETAFPLNADHRSICKFDSPRDPNYVTIRNSLAKAIHDLTDNGERSTEILMTELILTSHLVISSGSPEYYWLTGEPGSGKTVLASHIIRHLENKGADVCFHFFRHGKDSHQSASVCLRQVAYQMSLRHPCVRRAFHAIQSLGVKLERDDERNIWRTLFMREILSQPLETPQYWILDGVDECGDVSGLLTLFTQLHSSFPVRVCFFSRRRPDLEKYLMRSPHPVFAHHIDVSETQEDIKTFLCHHSLLLPVATGEGSALIDRVTQKSRGIFLWAKLALAELEGVHSVENVDDVLEEVPEGMIFIYARILETMAINTRELKLTRAILAWTICAARSLSLTELKAALEIDLATGITDMRRSVKDLCGQLLRIDRTGAVHVIHATMDEFFLGRELDSPLAIRKYSDHQARFRPAQHPHLQTTACTMFSEHIAAASADPSSSLLPLLHRFFKTHVLAWIEFLALHRRDLSYVSKAAQNIRQYLVRVRTTGDLDGTAADKDCQFIEQWTTDMVRMVTKFSRNLLRFPSSIFYLVPPLCPVNSVICLQYQNTKSDFSLRAPDRIRTWDECVSYIDYRHDRASSVTASDTHFAIGLESGHIRVYDAITCRQTVECSHGEPVEFLRFDNSSRRFLASGERRLSVFNLSGELVWTFDGAKNTTITAHFSTADDIVTAFADNSISVMYFSAKDGEVLPAETLGRPDCRLLKATSPYDIRQVDISLDQKILAIAYRSCIPVQLWSLERDVPLGNCWFSGEETPQPGQRPGTAIPTTSIAFNRDPAAERLAVTKQGGSLGIFDPWTGQGVASVHGGNAFLVACAPGGRILATGDYRGRIKLWEFSTLRLLHCLRSEDMDVLGLAFNGMGTRLYDIRRGKTKVWEPPILLRKDFPEHLRLEETRVADGTVFDHLKSEIQMVEAVGNSKYVLVGRANGSIELVHTSDAELAKTLLVRHRKGCHVRALAWNAKGYLASADHARYVNICCVFQKTDRTMEVQYRQAKEWKTGSTVRGSEWSPDGSKLLVSEVESDYIYWITDGTGIELDVAMSRAMESTVRGRKWAWLPQVSSIFDIVSACGSELTLYQTDEKSRDVAKRAAYTLTLKGEILDRQIASIAFGKTSRFLAVQLQHSDRRTTFEGLLVYCLDQALDEAGAGPLDLRDPRVLEPLLYLDKSTVRNFIGWRGDHIVYLDTELWICSIDVVAIKPSAGQGENARRARHYTRRRHMFVPYELIGGSDYHVQPPRLCAGTSVAFPWEDKLAVVGGALSSVFVSEEVEVDAG